MGVFHTQGQLFQHESLDMTEFVTFGRVSVVSRPIPDAKSFYVAAGHR